MLEPENYHLKKERTSNKAPNLDQFGGFQPLVFRGGLAFQVIRGILKVSDPSDVPPRRLERYWREIDLDCSGTVDFEEFVIWIPGGMIFF